MRLYLLRLVLACAILCTPYAHAAQTTNMDFILDGIDGSVELSRFKGQVVYLDFWASWCTPCRQSFPWMNEMQQRYAKKGLKIIAINLDSDKKLARQFISITHPSFTIAFDPHGTVAEQYNVEGMPSSYLIDRQGRLHSSHIGFRNKDKAALEQSIADLLDGKE